MQITVLFLLVVLLCFSGVLAGGGCGVGGASLLGFGRFSVI